MHNHKSWIRYMLGVSGVLLLLVILLINHTAAATTKIEDGWRIYVDHRYSYSIQYPKDWYVFPTLQKGLGALAQFYNYDRSHSSSYEMPYSDGQIKIEIVVVDLSDGLSPAEWITTQATTTPIRGNFERPETITIDDIEATKVIWRDDPYSSTIIMVPYHKEVLQIVIMPASAYSSPLLDKMLSSFHWAKE